MPTRASTDPVPLATDGLQQVFFDGFDGTTLDRSRWPIVYGGATGWNGAFRWDASQISVGGGELTIGLDRQADGLWAVGGLSTTPTAWGAGQSLVHGRVEIRAKASAEVVGAGPVFLLWPAGNDHWPPEVDILETPGGDGMFTNHWAGPGGEDLYDHTVFELDYSQWHTYVLDWTPSRLTLYVDGEEIHAVTQNIPSEAMSLGLQGYVGAAGEGWYGGSPNGSGAGSVDISVDWVRISRWTDAYVAPASDPAAPAATPVPDPVPRFGVVRDGVATQERPQSYDGPVSSVAWMFLGTPRGEAVVASAANDFLNLLGGDDAADGVGGDDVLDGGLGSNFLTGGAGHDVSSLDGRGAAPGAATWSTVADWGAGEELSIWGWRPGVSRTRWADSDGAAGFRGVTLHGDLDGDGVVDTSVTWTGLTRAQLPAFHEFAGVLWLK
jgi:Ca2+-binding RTX toxin-like protein